MMLFAALMLAWNAPLVQAVQPPAADAKPSIEQQNEPRLRAAAQLLRDHQPDMALQVLDTALSAYDADLATEERRRYCGMSIQEGIVYAGMAAKDKADAVVLAPGYCTAFYFKGFALTDLGRVPEAQAVYDRVVALAPMHAQFTVERGQLSRVEKDWPAMLDWCDRAKGAAAIETPPYKTAVQGAALRCEGYALVEEHKLDDAEQRYREALALNPDDAKAKGELTYIAGQRTKP